MLYLLGAYWPFLAFALLLGIGIGWWNQDPRSADEATAWLEGGTDEP